MADRARGDRVLAICTIVGAIVYLFADSRLPQLQIGDPMGPQVFPALIGIGLLISGLMLLGESWRKPMRKPVSREPTPAGHRVVLIGMALWTALYYFAFEPVGYLVSTATYMFALLAWFNRGRWLVNTAVAFSFTLSAYAVFTRLLQVVLPAGVLGI